jgi:hypothetical protein
MDMAGNPSSFSFKKEQFFRMGTKYVTNTSMVIFGPFFPKNLNSNFSFKKYVLRVLPT